LPPAKLGEAKPMPRELTIARERWRDQVQADPDLAANAFRVAHVIAGMINATSWKAFPSIATIAKRVKLTPRTVQTHVKALAGC
jgi:hypothetical protein